MCGRIKYEEKVKKLLLNRKKNEKRRRKQGRILDFFAESCYTEFGKIWNDFRVNPKKIGMISAKKKMEEFL